MQEPKHDAFLVEDGTKLVFCLNDPRKVYNVFAERVSEVVLICNMADCNGKWIGIEGADCYRVFGSEAECDTAGYASRGRNYVVVRDYLEYLNGNVG